LTTIIIKSILEVVKILKTEGYISHFLFRETNGKRSLEIVLKNGNNINSSISLVSRPSVLKYFSKKDIWKLSTKIGIFVLSTPQGVLSDREAKIMGTGGKVLLYIC
jgi:small subunit ribosomal protein S8